MISNFLFKKNGEQPVIFRGAGELRNQLMNTKSTDEVRALLDNFAKNVDETESV